MMAIGQHRGGNGVWKFVVPDSYFSFNQFQKPS